MSTKTLRKGIALVAVAALGAGILSVAPANAASNKADISAGTAISRGLVAAIATPSTASNADLTATIVSTGSLAINVSAGDAATNVTVSGGTFEGFTSGVASYSANGLTATSSSATAIVSLIVVPNAGVTTMTIKSYEGSVAAANLQDTLTVTVVAAATVGALSVSDSPANLVEFGAPTINSITDSEVTGIDTLGASVVRNGQVGQIVYLLRDSNLLRLSSSGVVSVSSSSPAIAVSLDGSFFSTSVAAANTNSYGSVYFAQAAANTPGTANVTLSYNGTAVWTKSVTIVGAVKSIVITAGDTTGKTGVSGAITTAGSAIDATAQTATADAGTFTFVTKDAAGNLVGGQTVTADSSLYNASVSSVALANSGATTKYSATAGLSGGAGLGETLGTWSCSTVAGDGKVGLSLTNALQESIKASISVKCAGSPSTYTASLDKASYVPGDIATLTITAKTSAGTTPFTAATLGTATTAELSIVGSQMTPVVAPTNSHTFGNTGAKTYKFIVGSTEGSYNMIVDLPKWSVAAGYAGAAQTVAYKVAGTGAVSNADVLKAIVSLIASINKQIAALQKALLRR
jgi:trimeric autotransporter adhesin